LNPAGIPLENARERGSGGVRKIPISSKVESAFGGTRNADVIPPRAIGETRSRLCEKTRGLHRDAPCARQMNNDDGNDGRERYPGSGRRLRGEGRDGGWVGSIAERAARYNRDITPCSSAVSCSSQGGRGGGEKRRGEVGGV